jgi:hypothetical protein
MTCPLHKDRERLLNIHGDEIEFTVQFVHLSGGMFIRFDNLTKKFVWSWNHMLNNKEKYVTEQFLDFMLSDFRAFCKNKNNRLREFVAEFVRCKSLEHTVGFDV